VLALRARRQIPSGPEVLAPRRDDRLAAKAEHVQRAKAMAKLKLCLCAHVILHQGQSKRARAVLMPALRPALYTRPNAKTTTAIITTDGRILRTESRNLQPAGISDLQHGNWYDALSMHATVQMKMGLRKAYSGNSLRGGIQELQRLRKLEMRRPGK
jgi:hypothetical protein